jgi:hypothetical protein
MRAHPPLGAVLVATAVVGCSLAPLGGAPESSAGVTLDGRLDVTDARGAYRLSQALSPYYKENIQRIQVYLRRTDTGNGAEVDLGSLAGNATRLRLRNLRQNASYTVRLAAYLAPDGTTAIDTGGADCETSFSTGTSLTLTPNGGFKLKLGPRSYSGKGGGVLAPSPGGYASPGAAEAAVELVSAATPSPSATNQSPTPSPTATPTPSPTPTPTATPTPDPSATPQYAEPPSGATYLNNSALSTASSLNTPLGSDGNTFYSGGRVTENYPVIFYYSNGNFTVKQQTTYGTVPVFPASSPGYVWALKTATTVRKVYVYYEAQPGASGATTIPATNPDDTVYDWRAP